MGTVQGAYCRTEDLRIGDIAPPTHTTLSQYVSGAAEEIDAALGHLYVTPIVIPDLPVNRPSILFLKKVNWLLASSRAVFDIAMSSGEDQLHATARSYFKEASDMLRAVVSGNQQLEGAPVIDPGEASKDFTGPAIFNEDPESLVEGFYTQRQGRSIFPSRPVVPYGYR